MADPTRDAAYALISAVLERGQGLDAALDALPPLEPRDRAAAHMLAATVLRHEGSIDAALEPYLKKAPPPPVRHILRLGAAQLLYMGTAAHAAVTTAVTLTDAKKLKPFTGLVNAVLRKLALAGTAALAELDQPRLDTPSWLWASWGSNARAIAVAHQSEAPLDLSLRPGAAAPPGGVMLPTGSVRMPIGTRVTTLPGFGAGDFWVQDAAAALPARLLQVKQGERVLDLCAAPGGKTAQLIAAGGVVTALDRDAKRLDIVRQNLLRLHMPADLVCADAADWQPDEKFSAILLDAPCTATGTIRRHPEILRLRRPHDVVEMTAQQDRLLAAAAGLLAPGGRLVYAVCSLQPEEGEARIEAACRTHGLLLDEITDAELAALPQAKTRAGALRTHPGLWAEQGHMDGFFAARLIKPA